MFAKFEKYNFPKWGYIKIPKIKVEDDELKRLNLKTEDSLNYLKALINEGFEQKIKSGIIPKEKIGIYKEKLQSEVEALNKLKFIDYILLIYKIIKFCHSNEILNSPGRGCLHGKSKILTENGYINLQDIKIGNKVVNSLGELDTVTRVNKFNCLEKLIKFKTAGDTSSNLSLTKDHKIFGIKCPFEKFNGYIKKFKEVKNLEEIFNENKLTWNKADAYEKDDYFVRYVGRVYPEKDIDFIDLAPFSEKYDENCIYENHQINSPNPLCVKTISKITKISSNCLYNFKKEHKNKKHNARSERAKNKLLQYLILINKTYEDFLNFNPTTIKKYNRYIKIDEEFCYVFGFFIGDGWLNNTRIGFAFDSNKNKIELEKIQNYFLNLGFGITSLKHKQKNLIQLYVNSVLIRKFFESFCQEITKNKFIDQQFLNLPKNKLNGLFRGLIESDGSEEKNRMSFDNTSKKLIDQVRWMAEFLGFGCGIYHRFQEKCNKSYKLRIYNGKTSLYYNNGKYLFLKIRNKKYIINTSKKVYDLTVQNNPSYSTDKYIVHNSAAGSLTLFCLGVTKVDPIKHDLLFERFVSAERAEIKEIDGEEYISSAHLADVDIDSDATQKFKINEFIEGQFPGRTAAIMTFGTYQAKVAIKESFKAIEEAQEEDAKRISNLVEVIFGKVQSLEDCAKENKEFKKWTENHKQTFEIAQKISGLIKNTSLHAAGIFICENPLIETVPLQLSSDKKIICALEMNDAQLFGVKVDNLGLKNLRAIKECLGLIGKNLEEINVNDPSIYQFLALNDQYYGIFQAEEGLGKKTLKSLECKNVDEIGNSLALGRPGCMKFTEEYINNKRNKEIDKTLDKRVEAIFRKNWGIILMQEDIMALSKVMAKFTPAETNNLRKCIGKKDKEKLKTLKDQFINQSIENNFDKKFVEKTWEQFQDCGDYLFCKSHGISYGYLTAITVYLKANFTKEFFLSLLSAAKYEQKPLEEIAIINKELSHFNIKLLAPDILKSQIDFSIENSNIRFGLGQIKGISDKTITKLLNFKHEYSNKFQIFHGANEANIDIRTLNALIKSGSMGEYGITRSKLVLEACSFNILTDKEKRIILQNGEKYNFDLLDMIKNRAAILDEKGRPFMKESRFETFKRKYDPFKQIYLQNRENINEKLTNWFFEREMLGFAHSTNITDIFREKLEDVLTIKEVMESEGEPLVRIVGKVVETVSAISKAKNPYFKVITEDDTAQIPVFLFKDKIADHESLNNGKCVEGDLVVVRGRKKNDAIFADSIATQKGIVTSIGKKETNT